MLLLAKSNPSHLQSHQNSRLLSQGQRRLELIAPHSKCVARPQSDTIQGGLSKDGHRTTAKTWNQICKNQTRQYHGLLQTELRVAMRFFLCAREVRPANRLL